MDWKRNTAQSRRMLAKKFKNLSEYDLNDALQLMGLARRRSASARFFSSLGLVLGGVAVGAAIGMMMAPRAGKKLGQNLGYQHGRSPAKGVPPIDVGTQGSNFS